jgi:uncharacterized delta-60 repeat protein
MPNWKKLIVSGSDAVLNSLNVTTLVTSSQTQATDIRGQNITVGQATIPLIFNTSTPQLVFNRASVLFDNDINVYKFSTLVKNPSNPFYFYSIEQDNFNVGAGASSTVWTIAVQSDGKIIIGGNFTSYSGSSINYIARLNTDGTLDTSFNVGAGANSTVLTTSTQSDGKIIIGGDFTSYSGSSISRIARLNTDGTLDTSFNVGAGASGTVWRLVTQSDGKIIIGGNFGSYSGSSINYIARLNTDGTRDTSFNVGAGASNTVYTTAIQSDGKIIIGGEFTSYSGFSINRLARLNTDGTFDTSFNVGNGTNSTVVATTIQPDGKIIIGGGFTSYSGSLINRIARLNTDGTLDTSFNVGSGVNDTIRTTAIQSDGKIIIGGQFSSYSGSSINRLARLNTDGTLDTSFNVGNGTNSTVVATTIQPDGKIIIGGDFSSYYYSYIPQNRITRLTSTGELDKPGINTFSLEDGKSYQFKITGTGAYTNTVSLLDFDLHGNALYDVSADTFSFVTPYQLNRGTVDNYTISLTQVSNVLGLSISGTSFPNYLNLDFEIIETIAEGSGYGSGYGSGQ